MQEKIKKYVESFLEGVGQFEKKEVPIYINEYLNFEFYDSIISFSLYLILTFLSCFFSVKSFKLAKKEDSLFCVPGVVLIVITIIFIFSSIDSGRSLIKIKTAPRVYLVDELINKK
jgi:hypothetical protein